MQWLNVGLAQADLSIWHTNFQANIVAIFASWRGKRWLHIRHQGKWSRMNMVEKRQRTPPSHNGSKSDQTNR